MFKLRLRQAAAVAATIFFVTGFGQTMQAQNAEPTDPQIVGIVISANKIDIDYAKIALRKSKNEEVLGFAHQMVKDHSTVLKSVEELAAKLHVTPAPSSTATSLEGQAREMRTKLDGLHGEAFNKAYIDNEIAFHKTVIDAMNNTLIPDSKNPELKNALKGALPLFQGHLEHAENVQKSLQ